MPFRLLPDLRGCEHHGNDDMTSYVDRRDGVRRWKCLTCQREKESPRHYGGRRCHLRGHLKTPWTWRRKRNGDHYCYACQRERLVERRREREETAA